LKKWTWKRHWAAAFARLRLRLRLWTKLKSPKAELAHEVRKPRQRGRQFDSHAFLMHCPPAVRQTLLRSRTCDGSGSPETPN
jgi:hypothetical protein